MKYIFVLSMVLMGCATTKMYETHLDGSGKIDGGVLKAAQDEEIQPFLQNFCANSKGYKITDQKLKDEDLGGFIIHKYHRFKFVDFRCEK